MGAPASLREKFHRLSRLPPETSREFPSPRTRQNLTTNKPMDYLVVLLTASFIATYALIIARLLPKE